MKLLKTLILTGGVIVSAFGAGKVEAWSVSGVLSGAAKSVACSSYSCGAVTKGVANIHLCKAAMRYKTAGQMTTEDWEKFQEQQPNCMKAFCANEHAVDLSGTTAREFCHKDEGSDDGSSDEGSDGDTE